MRAPGIFQVIHDLLGLLADPLQMVLRPQAGDQRLPVEGGDQRRHPASFPALPKVPKMQTNVR